MRAGDLRASAKNNLIVVDIAAESGLSEISTEKSMTVN